MNPPALVILNPNDRTSRMFDLCDKYKLVPIFLVVDQNNTPEINNDIEFVLNKCKERVKQLQVVYDRGSMKNAIKELKKFDVKAIVPYEETVVYGDKLASILKVPGNDPKTSKIRKDKYLLNKLLESKKITVIKSLMVKPPFSIEKIVNFFGSFPLVVKPSMGSSSMNVFIVNDKRTLENALDEFKKLENSVLKTLGGVVIQEYIEGEEYPINFVSYNGKHYFVDAWKYVKILNKQNKLVYKQASLLKPNVMPKKQKHQLDVMVKYGLSILNAMKWKYGPTHLEVKWDKNRNKPYLIEANLRMMGGAPFLNEPKFGDKTILETSMLSYLRNQTFFKKLPAYNSNPLEGYLVLYIAHADKTYKIKGVAPYGEIKKMLPSMCNCKIHFKTGEILPITTSYINCPMELELYSKSSKIINKDLETLDKLESDGLTKIFNK